MNQDVHYTGYSANPSDYECQDGELAMSLNLINEDGSSVKALGEVSVMCKLPEDADLLFIHSPKPECKYYIISRANKIYASGSPSVLSEDDAIFERQQNVAIKDINSVGNVIILLTSTGVEYFLFKDNKYVHLGAQVPFLNLKFELEGHERKPQPPTAVPLSHKYGQTYGVIFSDADAKAVADTVFAILNKEIAEEITAKGKFCHPFIVRYAYRLYDGTYAFHSAPMLMKPFVGMHPIAQITGSVEDVSSWNIMVRMIECRLKMRIHGDGTVATQAISELRQWEDIIKSVDIFISKPIYNYDINVTKIDKLIPEYLAATSFAAMRLDGESSRYDSKAPHYTCLNELFSAGGYNLDFPYFDDAKMKDAIESEANFYLLKSIPVSDLTATKIDLTQTEGYLNALVSRPTLDDSFNARDRLIPKLMFPYNARLTLANIDREIYPANNITDSVFMLFGDVIYKMKAYVFIRENSREYCLEGHDFQAGADFSFPYFFHPNTNAFKIIITRQQIQPQLSNPTVEYFEKQLQPHKLLNGSVYVSEWNEKTPRWFPLENDTLPHEKHPGVIVPLPNRIYTSQINNPFVYPLELISSVGLSEIKSLASAAKALSQGQFGQFPLYAFTDEGVWAMEVSSTGTYLAKQPITRDVCINSDGITQIDSAVLFPTNRGIMLISGSQTQCISDVLNTATPFDLNILPAMDKLHAILDDRHKLDNCIQIVPFLKFLEDCRMIYDYVHQRIIVYNEVCAYAYVYSFKSKLWGMMYSDIKSTINSYPNAFAVTSERNLVDFSLDTDKTQPGLLVTRPLKLGGADVMKTIDTLIQRGNFQRGHVQTVLYGSRNLNDWHLIWSSKDHYLRGFRGTPYKYFRVALLCNLDPGESIFGASINLNPRLGNQLR